MKKSILVFVLLLSIFYSEFLYSSVDHLKPVKLEYNSNGLIFHVESRIVDINITGIDIDKYDSEKQAFVSITSFSIDTNFYSIENINQKECMIFLNCLKINDTSIKLCYNVLYKYSVISSDVFLESGKFIIIGKFDLNESNIVDFEKEDNFYLIHTYSDNNRYSVNIFPADKPDFKNKPFEYLLVNYLISLILFIIFSLFLILISFLLKLITKTQFSILKKICVFIPFHLWFISAIMHEFGFIAENSYRVSFIFEPIILMLLLIPIFFWDQIKFQNEQLGKYYFKIYLAVCSVSGIFINVLIRFGTEFHIL